jgi:HD-like signal output (HDOD) protein
MNPDQAQGNPVDQLLEQAVREIGIPPRPAVLERINAEMNRPEPDPIRLARIISADVSLAAGLMKTANSPFFGLRGRVRTVEQALMMLGMDIASRAATGMVLRNTFPAVTPLERFWDASARIAQISGWLAQQIPVAMNLGAGDAYSFGLFRDCGIAVMMRKFPDYAATLSIANNSPERSFTDVELDRHPTNHAVVGCLLARTWWLPEQSCLAIRHHHDVPAIAAGEIALPSPTALLIALAQFAERVVQTGSGLSHTCEWDKMGPLCLGMLGLDEAEAEALLLAASSLDGESP